MAGKEAVVWEVANICAEPPNQSTDSMLVVWNTKLLPVGYYCSGDPMLVVWNIEVARLLLFYSSSVGTC